MTVWRVPAQQAGPRQAHRVAGHLTACGLPLGVRAWLPEDQTSDGHGRPWPRCGDCLALELGE